MDNQLKRMWIKEYYINYNEEDAQTGMEYLRDNLSYEEARVFFDDARNTGSAPFKSDRGEHFELTYENGEYTLKRRGW